MIIYVSENRVMVDGIQNGVAYSCSAHANKEATILRDNCYPHAKLMLAKTAEIPILADNASTPSMSQKQRRKPLVNRYRSFGQRACLNASQAVEKAYAAGIIVKNATLKIESIGARVTNWHTGYNLLISSEATATLLVALPWFVEITNEDVSNRVKTTGFNLTKQCEVSQLMASFGIFDKYAEAVEAIKTFEDENELKEEYEKCQRIEDKSRTKVVEIPLADWKDEILSAIINNVAKSFNLGESAEVMGCAIELAFEAGFTGEAINSADFLEAMGVDAIEAVV